MKERHEKRPVLGYLPPRTGTADVIQNAREAIVELEQSLHAATAKSEALGEGSPLLKLHVMLSTLFIEASRLCIDGYKGGRNRAAFALQRSLFEYYVRALAYARGTVDPNAAWSVDVLHRVAEDERQAGGGIRSSGVERDYGRLLNSSFPARTKEIGFEDILKRVFDPNDAEQQKRIYQRYRRPAVFAHGKLGVVDDVFESVEARIVIADRSLTIDPDAQLIAIAALACDFDRLLDEAHVLNRGTVRESLLAKIQSVINLHNRRRAAGINALE